MKNMVSRTLSVNKEYEFLSKLKGAGLNNDLAQKVIKSKGNDLAMKVIMLIQNAGFEATDRQKRIRKIMGNNFFGVEEAITHFGVNPNHQQLGALSEIPFSEAVLEQLKDTHILVAVFPLSILEIRSKVDSGLFYGGNLWCGDSFTKKRGKVRWQLVRKNLVDNSTFKSWQEQQALLSKDDEVPSAQMMVYTIIGHYLNTGEQLFKHIYVRTSSVTSIISGGSHVIVGFNSVSLDISVLGKNESDRYVGIAPSRKF